MVDIPEHLLLRSAEARAKALGISVEQALAEMKGESEPTVVSKDPDVKVIDEAPAPAAEAPAPAAEVPAPAGQPSAGINPSSCHPTNTSENFLNPSSTKIGVPFSWNFAP